MHKWGHIYMYKYIHKENGGEIKTNVHMTFMILCRQFQKK